MYLEDKDRTEYTGTESHVKALLDKSDISFFPIQKAMVLAHFNKEGELKALLEGKTLFLKNIYLKYNVLYFL